MLAKKVWSIRVMKSKRTDRHDRLQDLQRKLDVRQIPAEEKDGNQNGYQAREAARRLLIERKIQEAMEDGAFDNLPGRGKPLALNANPYLEPGQELAFGLLKNNGFAPEWIERDQAIRRELEAARSRLGRAWQHYQANPAGEAAWQRAVDHFAGQLDKLNRQIDDFNLIAPVLSCQRSRLDLAKELRRLP
jgi:DnaJ family protein C protein 28